MKRSLIVTLWLLLMISSLFSDIQFNYETSLINSNFGDVKNISLLDIDNDNIEEYCVEYRNESYIRQVIYNTSGDIIKTFETANIDNKSSSICNFAGELYYVEASYFESDNLPHIGISIFDDNEVLIDSISVLYGISAEWPDNINSDYPISFSFTQTDYVLSIFVGFIHYEYGATSSGNNSLTMLISFENDTLSHITDYPVYLISEFVDNDSLIAYRYRSWAGEGDYSYTHILKLLDIPNQLVTDIYELNVNWLEPDAIHISSFHTLGIDNANNNLILSYKSESNDEAALNFKAIDINTFDSDWEITEPFSDNIICSTILNHSNGNTYILYFLPSWFKLRNIENGSMSWQEFSSITPQYILDNNANEKIFFQVLDDMTVVSTAEIDIIITDYDNDNIEQSHFNIDNYPNPFNPSTSIRFSIDNDSHIELSIYNTKGQKIKSLVNSKYIKGFHSVTWNGEDEFGKSVSSGIYYYQLKINGKTEAVKKCLLLK